MKNTKENKFLNELSTDIAEAKKNGEKEFSYTTKASDYKKKKESNLGFSDNDLKPKIYEAYKYLLCKYNFKHSLIDPFKLSVKWTVKF